MNFLAKTITNLESRLDSVLLGEQEQQQAHKKPVPDKKSNLDGGSKGSEDAPTPERTGSPAPSIHRTATPVGGGGKLTLAERLAAATARSASPGLKSASPAPASAVGSARSSIDKSRGDLDLTVQKDEEKEKVHKKAQTEDGPKPAEHESVEGITNTESTQLTTQPRPEGQSTESIPPVPVIFKADGVDAPRPTSTPTIAVTTVTGTTGSLPHPTDNTTNHEAIIAQLSEDLAICELRRQEESHTASERIDTLENKLKLLARESADDAKRRATASPHGGLEKKLAEKEERIALLLEEGERLSKLELKNLTIIKKLRAKIAEDEKATGEVKRKLEKAEKEAAEGREKLKKAQEAEKKLNERVKAASRLESEVESLRREKVDKDTLVLDLKAQLASANSRADDAEAKARTEALEAERKTTRELREQNERIQSEAVLVEEKRQTEIGDLKAKIGRDSERAKMTEAELRSEVAAMETKLEVLRARAEEVSSGATGDAHSKLLRQVETLQTQYAIASENWQGIEGSLLARVAAVERERDELAKTEAEVRRKAREFNNKARRSEMELEQANSRIRDLEDDLESYKRREEALQKKVVDLESCLKEARLAIDRTREEFSRELTAKLEEQRLKWEEQLAASSFMRSPSPPPPRFSSRSIGRSPMMGDGYGQPPSQLPGRDNSVSGSFVEQGPGRERQSFSSPHRVDSLGLPQFVQHVNSSRTSLLMGDEEEDYFVNNRPSSSPNNNPNTAPSHNHGGGAAPFSPSPASPLGSNFRTPHAADMVSVSTVAAGPSVQLVERMSSSIRRLETEMAASRDELARTLGQRDEARAEIVDLMREVESKRELEGQVRRLQEEKEALDTRFQAALETLGEKMERVDELEEMVGELKKVYRELVVRSSGV